MSLSNSLSSTLLIYFISFTVTCGNPVDVQFSTNSYIGVNEGDIVIYTCVTGYAMSGQNVDTETSVCGANGQWAVIPTCVGKLRH